MKNITTLKALLASAVVFSLPFNSFAINAKPGLISATQPDGTEIKIRIEGSENNYRIYSEDGHRLITDSEGFYVFAQPGANGLPQPTSIRSINKSSRIGSDLRMIESINRLEMNKAWENYDAKRQAQYRGPGLMYLTVPSIGQQKALVILVEFQDKKFSMENPNEYYHNMMNQEGFSENGATGSARDYFLVNSGNLFLPQFDVYGPVTLPKTAAYYGTNDMWGNDSNAAFMILDACKALDSEIDYSQYDANNDGSIDNVYVFYAGYGEADGGGSETIWPHNGYVVQATRQKEYLDNVLLNHYACSNEIQKETNMTDGIGSFCHEYCHVLGLPDLYSTGGYAYTPQYWDLMAIGSYNNLSRTPPYLSSYERYALDWMVPELLPDAGEISLRPIGESNKAFILPTEKADEFYLIENRQLTGYDEYLPGHGMLLWHIDYVPRKWDNNQVNNDNNHQYVDLVEADGIQSKETMDGDAFPGTSNVCYLSAYTKPALKSWAGIDLPYEIRNISEQTDGTLTFTVGKNSSVDQAPLLSEDIISIEGNLVTSKTAGLVIFNSAGQKVANLSHASITLPGGIYIASDGESFKKFMIK